MDKNFTISIIVPIYNEEAVIVPFLEKTEAILKQNSFSYEIILVDDGSTDRTLALCKDYIDKTSGIRLIVFSRNYGHEMALTAGIEHAKGDFVIQIDADLQHPPELIPALVEKISTGYDIVYAARVNRQHQSRLKILTAKLFYKLARRMTGFDVPDDAGNFRIISRKVVDSIKRLKENNRHLLMLYAYIGFKSAAIPYECEPRFAGKSKYTYRKLINLALDSIISFSHRPLRYMAAFCVCISFLMTGSTGLLLLNEIFSHQGFSRNTIIIFIFSLLFSILFIFLAIISEYIGRILIESKNRPLYYIKEEYEKTKDQLSVDIYSC